jgi:hypothetical protein
MPIIISMEGTRPLTGPALPNLINAVRMLKSKSKPVPSRPILAAFAQRVAAEDSSEAHPKKFPPRHYALRGLLLKRYLPNDLKRLLDARLTGSGVNFPLAFN